MALIQISNPDQLGPYRGTEGVAPVTADELILHSPDAHWLLVDNSGHLSARCSLWWRTVPEYQEQRLGFVGHYAAKDSQAGQSLLHHASTELQRQGCNLAVGPLDGNTWRRYRFIVERGTEPPFFLEPDNPEDWPLHFSASGFREFASYSSFLNTDLGYADPRMAGVADRMEKQGVIIRQLDPARYDEELDHIFKLSLTGFRNNFLYSSISLEEFKATYRKVQPFIKPELTLLAEHEGRAVGFLFAIPDMLQAKHGEKIDTVVMKSIAVLPGKNYGGLGNLLMVRILANARALGYYRAIHALVNDSSGSSNMCAHYAQPMRRYALFCKELR